MNDSRQACDSIITDNVGYEHVTSRVTARQLKEDHNVDLEEVSKAAIFLKQKQGNHSNNSFELEELDQSSIYLKALSIVQDYIDLAQKITSQRDEVEQKRLQDIEYFLAVTLPKILKSKRLLKSVEPLLKEVKPIRDELVRLGSIDGLRYRDIVHNSLHSANASSLITTALFRPLK